MPQQTINLGSAPDDGTGDTLRVGGDKINDNFTELYTDKADKAGGTFTGDISVPDEAYDATAWNGSLEVPTKNAVRDKIESLGSGITELDDIPDVNAPTPANGDVLTWDSTPGEWVPAAPTGGSNALDDLTDVNAPTPSDGDVLTFNNGTGDWEPAAPSGGGWELAGAGQTATGVYDHAVDGTKATVDFTGLAGYTDFLIVTRNVTKSSTGLTVLQVSVNNGSSFYTTSGDYVFVTNAGVESNNPYFAAFHVTNATAARSGVIHLPAAGASGGPKTSIPVTVGTGSGDGHRLFVASTSPINALRILGSAGNINGGAIYVYAR